MIMAGGLRRVVLVGCVTLCAAAVHGQTFDHFISGANLFDLSSNGAVSVGIMTAFPASRGYARTASGIVWFGDPDPGEPAFAAFRGVSGDGRYGVGKYSFQGTPVRNLIGTSDYDTLGLIQGYNRGWATRASFDGSVVSGWCERGPNSDFDGQAFRWTEAGGLQPLGFARSTGVYTNVRGMSADGNSIVGRSDSATGFEAYRWTPETGSVPLVGLLTGYYAYSEAFGVSDNGNWVVGTSTYLISESIPYSNAVRWSRAGVIQELDPTRSGIAGEARAVSGDGSVIAGRGINNGLFVWTEAQGAMDAVAYFGSHGVAIPAGYGLIRITAISDDGTVFGGDLRVPGRGLESFLVTIPCPSGCAMGFIAWLAAFRRRR